MSEDFDNDRLAAAFEQMPRLLDGEPGLIRRGAFFDACFQVGIGAIPFDVTIAAGKIASLVRGPFVMSSWRFAVRGSAEALGAAVAAGARSRLARSARAGEARRRGAGRRPPAVDGEPAIREGPARASPSHRSRSQGDARHLRADRRPLHDARPGRPSAPDLFRGGGAGDSARLPAHRGRRRAAIPPPDGGRGCDAAFSGVDVRHAVARQVAAAGGMGERGLSPHHGRLHRDDRCVLPRAGARSPRRHGLLDRRPHRAQPRDRACLDVSRLDRAGVRRLPGALVRHRLAQPSRRARRRSLRRAGLGAHGAAKSRCDAARNLVDVQAERSRRVQGRSLLLSRGRGSARQGRAASTPVPVRSIC